MLCCNFLIIIICDFTDIGCLPCNLAGDGATAKCPKPVAPKGKVCRKADPTKPCDADDVCESHYYVDTPSGQLRFYFVDQNGVCHPDLSFFAWFRTENSPLLTSHFRSYPDPGNHLQSCGYVFYRHW